MDYFRVGRRRTPADLEEAASQLLDSTLGSVPEATDLSGRASLPRASETHNSSSSPSSLSKRLNELDDFGESTLGQ